MRETALNSQGSDLPESASPILKVLCVDDDRLIRRIATKALELDEAMEVRCVEDGERALAQLADPSWRPDCVLIDAYMPGLSGSSLLIKIRTQESSDQLCVIVMSAKMSDDDIVRYKALGANGGIRKPFDVQTLAAEVRALC